MHTFHNVQKPYEESSYIEIVPYLADKMNVQLNFDFHIHGYI